MNGVSGVEPVGVPDVNHDLRLSFIVRKRVDTFAREPQRSNVKQICEMQVPHNLLLRHIHIVQESPILWKRLVKNLAATNHVRGLATVVHGHFEVEHIPGVWGLVLPLEPPLADPSYDFSFSIVNNTLCNIR